MTTYGTLDVDVVQTSAGTSLGAGNASIMKNRIINGAMVIDQRNYGASITPTNGQYTVDRWFVYMLTAGKFTTQQNAGSVTPPVGFSNYLGATSTSAYSVATGDAFSLNQRIEGFNFADLGWGTANAKTVTLSAWVYSSLTGTFGGSVQNGANNRSYPFTYTISTANTWTQISITIPGDTTGTWVGATNGIGLQLNFGLGVGSTYSGTAGSWAGANYVSATGATSVVGTNGATFYITGVQLEVGSFATGYEYRLYQQEKTLCQYYAYNISLTASGDFGVGACTSGGVQAYVPYPVTMRVAPTVTFSTAGNFVIADGTAGYTVTSTGTTNITTNQATVNMGASGTTGGRAGLLRWNTGTAFILFSAEL